jgi:hypothetical protein
MDGSRRTVWLLGGSGGVVLFALPLLGKPWAVTTVPALELIDVVFDRLLVKKRVKDIHVAHVALEILVNQVGGIVGTTIGIQPSRVVSIGTMVWRVGRPKPIPPEWLGWRRGRILRSGAWGAVSRACGALATVHFIMTLASSIEA